MELLQSQPCQLFVNRMRELCHKNPITTQEMQESYDVAGGIPLWLIQTAAKGPRNWYAQRVDRIKSVIEEQRNPSSFYQVQSYMAENNQSSVGFKEFVFLAGGIENAVELLHGIPRPQRINRLFFHDLNNNQVALQYQYLKDEPIEKITNNAITSTNGF
eukprot:109370_1